MIFVCVGSREYQFDRLLKKIDELVEQGEIKDEIFGQIGQSSYVPKYYSYKRFIDAAEFNEKQRESDIIISHGGTGALIGALKLEKQVIAVPRLEKYGEHIDDHQLQVASVLEKEGYLKMIVDIDKIGIEVDNLKNKPITKLYNRPSNVFEIISNFIDSKD